MEKNLLKEVLSIQSYSGQETKMIKYIKDWCKKNNISCTNKNGNLYLVKGKAKCFPSFVAHTDTVHRIIKEMDRLNIVEHDNVLIALDNNHKQTGIGGDDKVGIYLALRMLKRLKACKVALFHSEEVGCVGSKQANLNFFKDCAFILQADRRGYGDWITNIGGSNISSKDFQNAIKPIIGKYKYKFANGAMTDVQALAENGVGISCANVSCGYYSPHTDWEIVKINEVDKVESMFYDISTKIELKRWDNQIEKQDLWKDFYRTSKAQSKDLSFYSNRWDEMDDNQTELFDTDRSYGDWRWVDSLGWIKDTLRYCKVCLDMNVSEKMGGSYFKYVCTHCGTLHEAHESLTEEQAIDKLIEADYKR